MDKEAIEDKIVNFINEKYNLNLLTIDSAAMAEDIYNLLGGDWRRERCLKDVNPARQSCHSILKQAMSVLYCGKTYFDFLDEEELPLIYSAMESFSASQNSELVERVKKLQSTCLAAAEEIQSKWDAHCDSEGYGPANLMRRLENGVGDWYDGYNSGQFTKLENKNSELKKENEGLRQLAEVWKEYSEFLDKESQSFIQFAHIHGMKVSDDAIKKGKELREKIKQLTK